MDEQALHPLLVIAVFIVRFLAIHPFQDGNGRLSRVLTTLLLLRAGYAYVPLRAKERLTIAQLAEITNANRNTLKVRLRELVAAGRVRQHGKARETWYSL